MSPSLSLRLWFACFLWYFEKGLGSKEGAPSQGASFYKKGLLFFKKKEQKTMPFLKKVEVAV